MRSLEALDAELREMILSIYVRPQMYASAQCVESVLWTAHRSWSLLHEREGEFQRLYSELTRRHNANSGHYAQYRDANPDGSEKDAYRFVFERWATISQFLGLEVPGSWD
jgi:hypothetical protein